MNNNPVLNKNLECIAKYNPNLKYKIMRINSLNNDISFVNTVLQEPNLMYNGVYLHNNYGAEAEAREIFEKLNNSTQNIHVVYGFGLGYLFKEIADNSKGIVIVYEPDIEILASVLEVVDFSGELSKENVFVFNDFELLKKRYISSHKYGSITSVTFLPSYKKLFEQEFSIFVNKLNMVMGSVIINYNYMKSKMVPAVKMLCQNLDLLVNEIPLNEFKNICNNQTAVIVSAGPSLDRDIEILKKYKDKITIFSVGQALRTLLKNGITPDFAGLIEPNNQMSQIDGLDVSDINLILEPVTYNELHKTKFKKLFSYPSHTTTPNLIWTNISNVDASPYFSSGTVSYTLLYAAKILGFKNIILSGQDLAFVDGKCYAKDARNTGLKFEYDEENNKVNVFADDFETFANSFFDKNSTLPQEQKFFHAQRRLESIKSNICFVKGINNKMIPTTNDYASFISQFEDFAKQNNQNINLYNTSLIGAKIIGFQDVNLEDILAEQHYFSKIELNSDFKYDFKLILNNLQNEIEVINDILKMAYTANTLITNYEKEYQHRKTLNETCIKYFKQLLIMYMDLTKIYAPKSRIFLNLHKAYSLELERSLCDNKNSDIDSIKIVYENLKNYIILISSDLKEISDILKTKAVKIHEMFDTKS